MLIERIAWTSSGPRYPRAMLANLTVSLSKATWIVAGVLDVEKLV
jgi:hypothetical protein